jgi:hypothetical protein
MTQGQGQPGAQEQSTTAQVDPATQPPASSATTTPSTAVAPPRQDAVPGRETALAPERTVVARADRN